MHDQNTNFFASHHQPSTRRDFFRILIGGLLAGASILELAWHRAAWARSLGAVYRCIALRYRSDRSGTGYFQIGLLRGRVEALDVTDPPKMFPESLLVSGFAVIRQLDLSSGTA